MKNLWQSLAGKNANQTAIGRQFQGSKLAIVFNDTHFGFEDVVVCNKALNLIKDLKPDVIVANGDLVDFYDVSSFVKTPGREKGLQREIDLAVDYLKKCREYSPNADIHFNKGNHEDRLTKYLGGTSPALANLNCLTFESLFKADEIGLEIHGAEGFLLNKNFLIKHGTRISKHATMSAKAEWESHLMSGISGHVHRRGMFEVTAQGGDFVWIENGCLCTLDPAKIDYVSAKPNWHHAITLIEFTSTKYHADLIRINDRKLYYNGKFY